MADQAIPLRLRLITYLTPGVPIKYFELLKEYLEEKLQCYVYLLSESRWSGPPADRVDPFTTGDADIGFVCFPTFHRMFLDPKSTVILLGIAAGNADPRIQDQPMYFSDVITHKDNCTKFKEFKDLRGSRWAYNDDYSLSGCLITLRELRKIGENANFFGNIVRSGAHLKSIKMVLNKMVDGAAIDSNTLSYQMKCDPELRKKLHIVTSWGPLPVYPAVVSSKLPEELRKSLVSHFLKMHEDPKWQARLNEFLVTRFVPVTLEDLQGEGDKIREEVGEMTMTKEVNY
ncbi:uncharacterized protein [Asterias amurensis]|uniref:uncharacterized protein n=1 Tax=Asterias amurensis TaxID=7602 RepID=UPI003AB6E92D